MRNLFENDELSDPRKRQGRFFAVFFGDPGGPLFRGSNTAPYGNPSLIESRATKRGQNRPKREFFIVVWASHVLNKIMRNSARFERIWACFARSSSRVIRAIWANSQHLARTVLDGFGHFWTVLDNVACNGEICENCMFVLFWTFLDGFGHFWTFLDIFGQWGD